MSGLTYTKIVKIATIVQMNSDICTIPKLVNVNVQIKLYAADLKHGMISQVVDVDVLTDLIPAHQTNTTIRKHANVNVFQNVVLNTQ